MARRKGGKKGSKNKIKVDFTGVESGGVLPEGDYPVKVKEVSIEKSQSSGNQYIKWVFAVVEGDEKGKVVYHNTSLQPQALFNLRQTLEALGQDVPDGAMSIDLDGIVGLQAGISVDIEKYQGKDKARLVDIFPIEELYEDEEDEEKEDDEEEEDEEDDEESDSDDDDEGDDEDDDSDDEDDDEDDEDDEDDDEDDDEEVEEYTEDELNDMDDEELIDAAEEFDVKPAKSKGKLNRKKTIKKILEAQEEE